MENDWFDEMALRDWLDKRIETLKHLKAMDKFNSQIEAIPTQIYVHLGDCIDIVADILGEELQEDGKVDEYTRYCFWYRGTKVLQLSKERLGKYARTD